MLNYAIPYKKDGEGETYLSPLQYQLLLKYRKSGGKGELAYDRNIEESWPVQEAEQQASVDK
ncbi:hypothetical protein [Niabella ginsengisoli]|uniref:Uncharacterized protein n=1 Tax=Niabella ginsengisoli TaxID=522298 RepID=A0ABS9SKL0_9BACT|nr:hypothetical protein [Niabella ginsengisoli]MCH5598919.1 hypothetical protein [Niabella ginsengisoli]